MDALKDLKWLLIIMSAMWIIWFFTGGPARMESKKPFIKPVAPLDTGELYGPRN